MKKFIFAVLVTFILFLPLPALAEVHTDQDEGNILKGIFDALTPRSECVADYINIPKKTMVTVGIDSMKDNGEVSGSIVPRSLTLNDECRALAQNMEVGGSGLENIGNQNDSNVLVATRIITNLPAQAVLWGAVSTTFERPLTAQELLKFSCLFPGGVNVNAISATLDAITSILPSSPEAIRIPTIINNLLNEGSLASNLAIELYSGVWQFLGVLALFKMIKLGLGR